MTIRRVGTIGYSISRGLGHLIRDFHRHGVVTDVLVMEHRTIPRKDWYPGAKVTTARNSKYLTHLREFVEGLDAMLFFETPFDWSIIPYCRGRGIRTYLVPMYECTPTAHERPDVYLCPSPLDLEYFPQGHHGEPSQLLTLPVDMPWRARGNLTHYIHNGGYLGMRGREGTSLIAHALRHARAPFRLTVRVQENVDHESQLLFARDPRVEYIAATVPFGDLHAAGEAYLAPQKFNGCSLPLQEAFASGYLMMTTDRYPMNTWLPRDPLLPVAVVNEDVRIGPAYLPFRESLVAPETIGRMMDEWYGRDVTPYSLAGREWGERNSWAVLGKKWKEAVSR